MMMFANVFSTFVSQMTHRLAIATALAAAAIPVRAKPLYSRTAPAIATEITLMAGLGAVHHPVMTASREAQRYFDQGHSLIYSFHYVNARRSSDRAAALNPQCAMCFWGAALARGQFNNHRMLARDKPGNDSEFGDGDVVARGVGTFALSSGARNWLRTELHSAAWFDGYALVRLRCHTSRGRMMRRFNYPATRYVRKRANANHHNPAVGSSNQSNPAATRHCTAPTNSSS